MIRYGYEPGALIASPLFYQTIIHPDDRPRVMELLTWTAMTGNKPAEDDFRMRANDGAYIWLEVPLYADPRRSRTAAGNRRAFDRYNGKKKAADKISVLATTDALTGLANRATFIDWLRQTFAVAKRGGSPFAVLYLDLDRFKDINDTLGHSAGDLLLMSVGERLKGCVRETDLLGRLGGDEFAVLQTNLGDVANAGVLAAKIQDALSAPYPLGETQMRISVSIGISPYTPRDKGARRNARASRYCSLSGEGRRS